MRHARGHKGEGHQVETIMLEHFLERPRITGSNVLKIARRNLESRHIVFAPEREEGPLEAGQSTAFAGFAVLVTAPQPARRMKCISVRKPAERRRPSSENETC